MADSGKGDPEKMDSYACAPPAVGQTSVASKPQQPRTRTRAAHHPSRRTPRRRDGSMSRHEISRRGFLGTVGAGLAVSPLNVATAGQAPDAPGASAALT